MRVEWCVAVACLAVTVTGGVAQAQSGSSDYARPGAYGGGFLELLVNGASQPAPVRRQESVRTGDPLMDAGAPRHQRAAYGFVGERMLSSGDRVPEPSYTVPAQAPMRQAALSREPLQDRPVEAIARAPDPRYSRQVVAFEGSQRPGTIVVDTPSKFLYLVQPGGRAIRYGIGVGRPGFAWSGLKTISQKREWPDWTPPSEMILRRPDLPRHMSGGPGNPLGARALYLGSSLYRIHGTNEPHTIGQNVSSGCIRMMNEDVIDLYERTPVGTRVEVL
ncbi:L,D-transpeptidase [Methylobacterium sp. BTF04]|uniref:L,D-transpeptidase n=1 Tax=Methylobacterium sp. BTF04 TaxID=2708300 RepID=UPI0013D8A52F|nr:L,D-transpeptidase [Methylobacterium sp. BTF04]NEU11732.1 L,D-transpeptidase [Methylobacterium sp. BTF04]